MLVYISWLSGRRFCNNLHSEECYWDKIIECERSRAVWLREGRFIFVTCLVSFYFILISEKEFLIIYVYFIFFYLLILLFFIRRRKKLIDLKVYFINKSI